MSIGIRCLLADDAGRGAGARRAARRAEPGSGAQIEADAGAGDRRGARHQDVAVAGSRARRRASSMPGWHQGVVGLVASRIKDRIRPPGDRVRADAGDGQLLRGSARSVAGVHVRDVLEAIATRQPGLIGKFGGHAMAAGLTLAAADLDRFARAFDAEVARWQAGRLARRRGSETDGELAIDEICLDDGAAAARGAGPGARPSRSRRSTASSTIRKHARGRREAPEDAGCEPGARGARFDAIAFNCLPRAATRAAGPAVRSWSTGSTSTNTRASGGCSCWSSTSLP